MAGQMTKGQIPMTKDQAPSTKQIPNPKSEIPNPQSEIPNPQSEIRSPQSESRQSPHSVRRLRQRLAPQNPPSARNCRVYVAVADEGLSQPQAAQREGLSQGRVCRIVQAVEKWIATSGKALDGLAPRQQLHLALLRQRRELNRLLADAERMMELAQQPYDSLVKIGKNRQGEEEQLWKLVRREPPRVGFLNLRDRILERLVKLAQAECEVRGGPSVVGKEIQDPQSELSKCPDPEPPTATVLQSEPLPVSAPLDPPNWLAYVRCPEPETYDASPAQSNCGKSNGKKTCRSTEEPYAGASLNYMARYWRYQALGLRQELPDRERQEFVGLLLALDKLAQQAHAASWAELLARPSRGGDAAAPSYSPAECRALRCIYLDKPLELDFEYADWQRQEILSRYDPGSGRLRWWQGGEFELPDEDLRWLLDPGQERQEPDAAPAEDGALNPGRPRTILGEEIPP